MEAGIEGLNLFCSGWGTVERLVIGRYVFVGHSGIDSIMADD